MKKMYYLKKLNRNSMKNKSCLKEFTFYFIYYIISIIFYQIKLEHRKLPIRI